MWDPLIICIATTSEKRLYIEFHTCYILHNNTATKCQQLGPYQQVSKGEEEGRGGGGGGAL